MRMYLVHQRVAYLEPDHETQTEREIVQRSDAGVLVIHFFEDEREGRENEVHDAVQERSVDGGCLDRGMREHHDERQDQSFPQDLAKPIAGVVFRPYHHPAVPAAAPCDVSSDRLRFAG